MEATRFMVPMPDGVELATWVYRLGARAASPSLLHRTPYGAQGAFAGNSLDSARLIAAGFNLVVQDSRGRFESTGQFEPFVHEAADGAATIAWLSKQPWSLPQVGMLGRSYAGNAQWLAAAQRDSPAELVGIAPEVACADAYDGWTYQSGAFQLGFALYWVLEDLARLTQAHSRKAGRWRAVEQRLDDALANIDNLYGQPARVRTILADLAPYYFQWQVHRSHDHYWAMRGVRDDLQNLRVPALIITGWYDIFLAGSLADYQFLRAAHPIAVVRERTRLVVGPWSHCVRDCRAHDISGHPAKCNEFDLTDIHISWFKRQLTGVGSELPRVQVFVTGLNDWKAFDEWPPPEAQPNQLALLGMGIDSEGGRRGDLKLTAEFGETRRTFIHDPQSPVPTLGGATLMRGIEGGRDCGPVDQRPLDGRSDILRYRSQSLAVPLILMGPVTASLSLSAPVSSFDILAKLIDEYPDGPALLLTEGIARTRDAESASERRVVEIEIGHVAHLFRVGHRLRLDIAGSSFPRFEVFPSSETLAQAAPGLDARLPITVWHDLSSGSRLNFLVYSWTGNHG